MLCWGKADCGALGVGGVDELTLPTPTWNKALSDKHVSVVGKHGACVALLLVNIWCTLRSLQVYTIKCDSRVLCIMLKLQGCFGN